MKWILEYLRGMPKAWLCYGKNKPLLVGYTAGDMASNLFTRRSTLAITFACRVVLWQSRLHKYVSLSIIEVKFITTTKACKEMIWFKRFLDELHAG